ncbi:phage tail protein [Sphingopyxis sp. PET50]|uniref:phage tail protein n=1 Tax=Sphingopyxis sp. PET50 TaxID=2976533 RepID=UPI0021AE5ADD|nr:tail fiber protein [Sphingopyxis sp. PET50]
MAFANRSRALLAGTCLAFGLVAAPSVSAQDYRIGEIIKTSFTFCPRGTLSASGQILSIAQNTALFSLLGTTYGGNGQTTFALPDMRGRYSMKDGTGPGLSPRTQGERGGTETTTLTLSQMPLHAHTGVIRTTSAAGDSRVPSVRSLRPRPRTPMFRAPIPIRN